MSLVLGADTITNPNLPNWEVSRIKYAGSLVAETVISELTTNNTITNPNFANRDVSRSRVAETVISVLDLGTALPNPNLPNWDLSRIECAGSRVAETVISELTTNTITNPSNLPKRNVSKSRVAETLIADLGTEVPNPNLPNWDLSRIECAGSRVAETVVSELTTVNPRFAQPPLALHGGTYVAVEMTNLRAWLRENYEPDPNAVMEREEVQKHWLTANGFNPSTVSNLLSFQIKMGKAINIEFGSCGKMPFCVNGPRKLEGKKLKNLYKGLKRKE